jgi:hypothetical protein
MSIFKETLPKFVIDQLTIREAIVKMGNDVTPDGSGNMPTSRTASPRVKLKGSEKNITIDSSAFFTNAISKQCVLRMSSGVDVKPGTFPQFTEEPTGVKLAQRFVLESGVPTEDFIKVKDEDNNTREVRVSRGGFAKAFEASKGKGSAYGDSRIRSSARDGFGIVPMPGITDANIRTKTAYGSLRDAKINFVCHNRDQLEVLELLYMRPGYPVLLEWGWLPYISNDGRRENFFPYMKEWWESKSTTDQINEIIIKRKKESGGNYDAMNGIVKNFEIKARPDGGYDCSCELISLGEVLEGLKSKPNQKDDIGYRTGKEMAPIDTFLYYLAVLDQISKGENIPEEFKPAIDRIINEIIIPSEKDKSDEAKIQEASETQPVIEKDPPENTEVSNIETSVNTTESTDTDLDPLLANVEPLDYGALLEENNAGGGFNSLDRAPNQATAAANYDQGAQVTQMQEEFYSRPENIKKINNYDVRKVFAPFMVFSSDTLSAKGVAAAPGDYNGSNFNGVTWDLVVEIFNHFVLPQIKETSKNNKKEILNEEGKNVNIKEQEPETLSSYTFYEKNTNKYLTYSKTLFPSGFKAAVKNVITLGKKENVDSSNILGGSLDKNVCLLPHQFDKVAVKNKQTIITSVQNGLLGVSEAEISDYSIGKIFLNISYLLDTYSSMFYDKEGVTNEFNFLDYFKKVWEQDVNDACASQHNFIVNVDPQRNNKIRIIDYDVQTLDVKLPTKINKGGKQTPAQFSGIRAKDVFEFKIQSNESIVRDFTYNTSIPANMASIISIAAGAPNDVSALDEVSFASFSQNIRSRFSTSIDNKPTEKLKDQFEEEVKSIRRNLKDLIRYISDMYSDKSLSSGDETSTGVSLGSAKDIVKNMESMIFRATSRDYSGKNPTYKRLAPKIPSKSAVIPLRFNAKMDGISGMVIGNVFKVDKTRLPKGYQRDDIAFIITTEQQNITSGQDWTTDITGQLIILDLERERVELDGEIIEELDIQLVELDNRQQAIIDDLNITPGVKELFTDFILEVQETTPYYVQLNSGYRDFTDQLNKRERWDNGDKQNLAVRPATPGLSLHQYGLAIDMNPVHENGTTITSTDTNDVWEASGIVAIADRLGLRWGGRFEEPNRDAIHFDLPKVGGYVHPDMKDSLLPFVLFEIGEFQLVGRVEDSDGKLRGPFKRAMKKAQGNQIDFTKFDKKQLDKAMTTNKAIEEEEKHDGLNQNATYSGANSRTYGGTISDERLKTNIIKVGNTEYGIPLYEFNYKNVLGLDHTSRFRGIMAQDLLKTNMSKAVILNNNSYYSIDYSQLNINLEKIS